MASSHDEGQKEVGSMAESRQRGGIPQAGLHSARMELVGRDQ